MLDSVRGRSGLAGRRRRGVADDAHAAPCSPGVAGRGTISALVWAGQVHLCDEGGRYRPAVMGIDWVQWLALSGGAVAVATYVEDRRQRARADAASVYVEVPEFLPVQPPRGGHTRFVIVNDGPLPILRVSVSGWGWDARRRLTWRVRPVGSWMTGGPRLPGGVFPQVMARSRTDEHDLPPLVMDKDADPGVRPPVMLVFRDGHGRSWVRWPDGRLSRAGWSWYHLRGWRRARQRRPRQAAR